MPTRPTGGFTQDWEPVVLHKSKPKSQILRDQKSINQASVAKPEFHQWVGQKLGWAKSFFGLICIFQNFNIKWAVKIDGGWATATPRLHTATPLPSITNRRTSPNSKKIRRGSNKKQPATAVYARKLDEAAEPGALDRVATEVRQLIQRARIEKKMSQAELAKQINERPQVVQEYENGKAVPNQGVLAKMERVLGVKLRGKIHKS